MKDIRGFEGNLHRKQNFGVFFLAPASAKLSLCLFDISVNNLFVSAGNLCEPPRSPAGADVLSSFVEALLLSSWIIESVGLVVP